MPPVYHLKDISKTRITDGIGFRLVVPELSIERGEKVALVGESGCGKSTLLDMLALVLRADDVGTFQFQPSAATTMDVRQTWNHRQRDLMGAMRQHHVGYVTQTGGLLPFLTVRENISLPRTLSSLADDGTVLGLAETLGIGRQLDKQPAQLSVGERQRVAIARALAHKPSVVIADEPTASLDPITAQTVMTLFLQLVDRYQITMILASHDWITVEKLGLRCVKPQSRQLDGGTVVESVFTG